jgi:hypothetical protein
VAERTMATAIATATIIAAAIIAITTTAKVRTL